MIRIVRAQVTGILSAVVAVAAGAACSSDAEPQGVPTPTASTTTPAATTDPTTAPTTAREGPEEPSIPAAARAPGRAGAEAFVRYYIDLLNYAGVTGDAAGMRRSSSGCVSCQSLADAFEATYQRGGHYTTTGWQITSDFTVRQPDGNWASLLEVRQAPIVWVKAADAVPQRFAGKRLNLRFSIERHKSGWTVVGVTQS